MTTAAVSQPAWDVIVIGSGIGGLVTASQLAAKGAKTLVLERYLIPGGSGGSFHRKGYTFDVGASMIFGFGENGHTNLLTRALADVGQRWDRARSCSAGISPSWWSALASATTRLHARMSARFPHSEGIGIMTPGGRCSAVWMRCRCYRSVRTSPRCSSTPLAVWDGSLATLQRWRRRPQTIRDQVTADRHGVLLLVGDAYDLLMINAGMVFSAVMPVGSITPKAGWA